MAVQNAEIAVMFDQAAELLDIQAENQFRVRAYRRATDAHSVNALQYMRFGIDQGRRGWLTADDVLNTRSLAELRKLLKR